MKLDGNVYFTAGGKHQFCKKKKNLFAKDDTQRQKDRE